MLINKSFKYGIITTIFFMSISYLTGLGHESGLFGVFITLLNLPVFFAIFTLIELLPKNYHIFPFQVALFAICATLQWSLIWSIIFWLKKKISQPKSQ